MFNYLLMAGVFLFTLFCLILVYFIFFPIIKERLEKRKSLLFWPVNLCIFLFSAAIISTSAISLIGISEGNYELTSLWSNLFSHALKIIPTSLFFTIAIIIVAKNRARKNAAKQKFQDTTWD